MSAGGYSHATTQRVRAARASAALHRAIAPVTAAAPRPVVANQASATNCLNSTFDPRAAL